jgi:hypothetical protein
MKRPKFLTTRPGVVRALIMLPLLAAGIALFPPPFGKGSLRLHIGERAPRTVIAEFGFPVLKDSATLAAERDMTASKTPIALVRDDSVSAATFHDLGDLRGLVTRIRSGTRQKAAEPTMELSQPLLVWLMLEKDPSATLDQAEALLQDALDRGLVEEKVESIVREGDEAQIRDAAGTHMVAFDQIMTPRRLREAARNRALARGLDPAPLEALVERFGRANLHYDPQETDEIRLAARDHVDPVAIRVEPGERIVVAGEKVTAEILSKLVSYDSWRMQREIGPLRARIAGWVGRLLLLLVAIGSFSAYLRFLRPDLYKSNGDLALLSWTAALVMGLSAFFLHVLDLPALMIPVSAAPILIALLFDERLALVMGLALAGLIGLITEIGAPAMAILGVGAVTSVYCVRGLTHRRQFYRLVLWVPAVHLTTMLAIALTHATPLRDLARDVMAAIANPILTAGLAIFVIPLAELGFRKCSDITLLELSDLNRPLLRRLMVEAPGTYHHSLMVGTLAEAAARVGGGKPLLSRVIGYYHDIGKISKPGYFIENIPSGRRNPHDKLSPSMSRLVLESHVREGVVIAQRERLPQIVVEGIRQHHGNSLMAFFWHKARRQDSSARELDYRYPGPRPQFREAALAMLADQIDAASRALEDPTPSRIKGVVVKVLETRLTEGDLDDSELTLSDLARIRDAFVPILVAFFHARTAYQAPEEDAGKRSSARDRESTAKGATPQG